MKARKYREWTLIDWDGNFALGYKCWRKSFEKGHVSIGVGEFMTINYDYGSNSHDSLSSTRARKAFYLPDQTEEQAKNMVDRNNGYHNYKDNS